MKINVCVHEFWKTFKHILNKEQQEKLEQDIAFEYDSNTTFFEFLKYLNSIYEDIIIDFEGIDKERIDYKRNIKDRYRIFHNNNYIYIYDLNSKLDSFINIFETDKIVIFFSFFSEFGGRIQELKGMQFYMHSKEKGKHNLPHVHVKYKNEEVVISINGKILAGSIDSRMQKMAKETILNDKESLLLKWNNMTDGEKFIFKNTELIRFDGYL